MNTKFAFLLLLLPLAGFVEATQYFTIAEVERILKLHIRQ